ncbi:MAG: hypothetical protein ACRD5Z_13535 [Bryobacteraceae bacterium]
MTAVVEEIFGGFLRRPNLREDTVQRVLFTVVQAQTALTFMHM